MKNIKRFIVLVIVTLSLSLLMVGCEEESYQYMSDGGIVSTVQDIAD